MRHTFFTALILAVFGLSIGSAPRAVGANKADYVAHIGSMALPTLVTGQTASVDVPLSNIGGQTWSAANVFLSYHWEGVAGNIVVWDGLRASLGSDVAPGTSRTIAMNVRAPDLAGPYLLQIELVREGIAWFGSPRRADATIYGPVYRAGYMVGSGGVVELGQSVGVPVTLANIGTATWSAANVFLSYHWTVGSDPFAGRIAVWDGARTSLGTDLAPGSMRTVTMNVAAPPAPGEYVLRIELVREGIAWFSDVGTPAAWMRFLVPQFSAAYSGIVIPRLYPGTEPGIPVTVTNTGTTTWAAGGDHPIVVSYHVYNAAKASPDGAVLIPGRLVEWNGQYAPLPGAMGPGETATIELPFQAPQYAGTYIAQIDLLQAGVIWFSAAGVLPAQVAFEVIPLAPH